MYYLTDFYELPETDTRPISYSIGIANKLDKEFQLDIWDKDKDQLLKKAHAILETLNNL